MSDPSISTPQNKKTRGRSGSVTGSVVSFHDIKYAVAIKKSGEDAVKVILKEISGVFKPGMNAILGPTGSGKTSLLDVLAARKDPKGLSGHVLIDGGKQPENFRCTSGYVVQDDIVMGALSIRENLEFSAALRLPRTVSKEEREERVNGVIDELGLTLVANSKVGTELIRGVSGGERKRTNVGMELIIKPSVLFLDEPTTGLDASTANAVMHLLAKLSKRGRTIIFSIHQPRYSIFKLFDTMHLLTLGETAFHGPARECLDYFSSVGFECEEHNNPPDFFLDVINGDSTVNRVFDKSLDLEAEEGTSSQADDKKKLSLSETYQNSVFYREMKEETDNIYSRHHNMDMPAKVSITYPTSFFSQLYLVSRRALWCTVRNPLLAGLQFVAILIFALVVGIIYFDMDLTISAGLQNRAGATFFLVMQMMFGNLNAIELFIRERVMFLHESASGFYRVSVYFIAKAFCDLIPMRLIPATLYALITYFMLGLQVEVDKFFIFYLTLLLVTFASTGVNIAISSSFDIVSVATLVLAMSYVFMMLFGGLLVNISSLPVWLQWLQYLSIFRFGINALLINELRNLVFCDTIQNVTTCIPGTDYLEGQGIDYSDWGLWQNEVGMVTMGVGFMLLGYIQLRRKPKVK